MSPLRRIVTLGTDLACRAAGRRTVVRAARFVFRRASLDVPNDLATNGESCLQRRVLELSPPGADVHVVDVGANVGRWSRMMLAAARQAGRLGDLDLHSFEPSSYTFSRLTETLDGQPVVLNRCALGGQSGFAALHVLAPGAGRNSLHRPSEAGSGSDSEEVPVITLDEYAARTGLTHLALVKIDTEGHDLVVLRGARSLLAQQRIEVIQFEYNHRWVDARFFLRDAFELLGPLGYHLGKLTPFGIEFYPGWDPELETFVEGNYVACIDQLSGRLPAVVWWKSGTKARASWPAAARFGGWPRLPEDQSQSAIRRLRLPASRENR